VPLPWCSPGWRLRRFYALLRELRLERIHAVSITVLALLFPLSDSVRFWSIASISGIGIASCLAGAVVALQAFDAPRRCVCVTP
jgi:hypothetical protein